MNSSNKHKNETFFKAFSASNWHKKYILIASVVYTLLGLLDEYYISVESNIDLIQRISISILGVGLFFLSNYNKSIDKDFKSIFQLFMGLMTAHMIYLIASCHFAISHVVELIVIIIVGSLSFDKIKNLYIYHGINASLLVVLTHWITNPEIDIYTYLAIFIAIFITAFIATYINLQSQIKIKEELDANQTLLKSIFIDANDALLLCEPVTNKIVDCNKEGLKLIRGNNMDKIDNFVWYEILDIDFETVLSSLQSVNESWHGIVPINSKKVEYGDVSAKRLLINGNYYYLVRIIDITARLEAERKQKELEKEVEVAEIAAENKAMFLSNMSHEIRTPINAIISLTSMLLDDKLPNKAHEYIKLIQYSSDNLLAIVNDILDYSKIDSKSFSFEKTDFSLKTLLNKFIQTNKIKAEEKGLELLLKFDEKTPNMLLGDPYRLNQILLNLVSNAIKFTHQGSISLEVECTENRNGNVKLFFSVNDTGIGIEKSKFDQIFESFMQANTSTTRVYGGTGLGLSITQKLLKLQNSEILLDSEVGKGSTFSFFLDFEISEKTEQELKIVQHEKDKLNNNILQSIKLLLVEDNEMNQYVAKQLFERQGIRFDIAADGDEAFALLKNQDYDIILLDIQLPNISGYEIASTLRSQDEVFKNTNKPIIALTANAFEEVKQKAFASGMNDFVTKPFRPKDLIDAISRNLSTEYFEGHAIDNEKIVTLPTENISLEEINDENKTVNAKFDMLRQLTFNNEAAMQGMVNMFLKDTPLELEKIRVNFDAGDYSTVARITHAIKPKFTYMGAPEISTLCKEIEILATNNPEAETLGVEIGDLEKKCNNLLEELKKEFIS